MSNTIAKVLYPVPSGVVRDATTGETKCTHIKCTLDYHLGGHSWGTGQQVARGYHLSITPVCRENRYGFCSESFVGFSGGRVLLVPCARRGGKAEREALARFEGEAESWARGLYPDAEIDFSISK